MPIRYGLIIGDNVITSEIERDAYFIWSNNVFNENRKEYPDNTTKNDEYNHFSIWWKENKNELEKMTQIERQEIYMRPIRKLINKGHIAYV